MPENWAKSGQGPRYEMKRVINETLETGTCFDAHSSMLVSRQLSGYNCTKAKLLIAGET